MVSVNQFKFNKTSVWGILAGIGIALATSPEVFYLVPDKYRSILSVVTAVTVSMLGRKSADHEDLKDTQGDVRQTQIDVVQTQIDVKGVKQDIKEVKADQ